MFRSAAAEAACPALPLLAWPIRQELCSGDDLKDWAWPGDCGVVLDILWFSVIKYVTYGANTEIDISVTGTANEEIIYVSKRPTYVVIEPASTAPTGDTVARCSNKMTYLITTRTLANMTVNQSIVAAVAK